LRVTGACMTPNTQRFTDLTRLIDECEVYGVLDLTWKFCAPFEIESHRVKELARDDHGLPFLHVVTDYSLSDGVAFGGGKPQNFRSELQFE